MYVSTDNGSAWQDLTTTLTPPPSVRVLAFDPVDRAVMYAGTRNYGLLRTEDGGRTWSARLPGTRINAVATDPLRRNVAYAAGSDTDGGPVFYRSVDWGQSWDRATVGLDARFEPTQLLVDPHDSSRLFLGIGGRTSAPYIARYASTVSNAGVYAPQFA